MKKIVLLLIILIGFLSLAVSRTYAATTFWGIQSIDTMKLSRDSVKDPSVNIPFWVEKVAQLHANYIAIDTPYDEQFFPVLQSWVTEARKHNLHVWFRGNFSGWEGWFNYPKLTSVTQHYALTKAFIAKHPTLFENGDIFTPAPEPENGIIGDPRNSSKNQQAYNLFLVTSYSVCKDAMQQIGKEIKCGYFSMNGDIALGSVTQQTINMLGVVVIDHYVTNVSDMGGEVDALYQKFGKPIIIGEFGAPIPDINGDMTQLEQADFIRSILDDLYIRRQAVQGVNYWVVAGGSTALFQNDGTPNAVVKSISDYYYPQTISGTVTDTLGNHLGGIRIQTPNGDVTTNANGMYSFSTPNNSNITLTIQDTSYRPFTTALLPNQAVVDPVLQPIQIDIWYRIKILLQNILQTFTL